MSQVSLNSTASQLISNNTNTSNYVLNTSNFLQQIINTKQSTIIGGVSTITTNNLTTGMVLVSDVSGKVSTHGTVTSDELTFLDGVTSSIQTQLNAKEPSFTVLGLSKGGIGTTTLAINRLIGSGNTANQIVAISAGTGISISGGTISGAYTGGTNITVSGTTIGVSGVIGLTNGGIGTSSLAINTLIGSGNTANQIVAITAGTGISISGGTISGAYTAGTGVSISGTTIVVSSVIGLTNGGIGTSSLAINTLIGSGNTANQIIAISAGSGISISGGTIGISGVIGLTYGGIGTSSLAINTLLGSGNTANQIVAISAGTGISISGGTISGAYTAGTSVSISGGTIGLGVIGITNGGIGTTTITANSLLGATTANTISTISLGTGLSITGSTLNVSSTNTTPILSLANNYIDLNITNIISSSNAIIKETFDNTIMIYNKDYNITNNSNYIIKNILNFNNNYILQQSDYIQNINNNNIVSIASSGTTTVYLENTGKVLACGYNTSGQGISGTLTTTGTVYVPRYVLGTSGIGTQMTGIVSIICSQYHTVYLENTGKVLACGSNASSYVGFTGTLTTLGTVYVSQYVLGTSGVGTQMTGIINIVCSNYHTVYLENTGKVLASGANGIEGITGTHTTGGTANQVYVPQYVLGTSGTGQMTGIVSIICSTYHTVYLENTGKVLACGNNGGTVGLTGTLTINGTVYVPQYVLGTSGTGVMTGIVSIVCSNSSTVYLENTGKVLACGYNNGNTTSGQGITGTLTTTGTVYVPQYVLGTNGTGVMTGIVSIACSNFSTVYLENTGNVLACGFNSTTNGITGTLTTNGAVYVAQYVLGTSGTGVMTGIVSIVCSINYIVYLENTGKVLACGSGWTGTLTTTGTVYTPKYVLGTNGTGTQMTGIVSIISSSGGVNTIFLENTGKVLACGNNSTTSITGTKSTIGAVYVSQYVIYTQNMLKNNLITGKIKNAINGYNCILAITDTDNVIANYDNTYGKLGTRYPTYNYNNFVINYTGSGNLSGVTKIACGLYHTVFLLNTNTAYSCGFNNYGQLGTNNTTSYNIPTAITNGTSISNIACGLYHTVLLSGTTASSCGLNNYGQLGLSDNNNRLTIANITLANVSDIDCGEYFTVLKVGSIVYSTGLNDKGQLGIGNTTNTNVPTQVLAINNAGGTITNVIKIKCTKNNIVFLLLNNTIAICGDNINNIYNDTTISYYSYPSLLKIMSETKTNISDIYTNIYSDEIYIKTNYITNLRVWYKFDNNYNDSSGNGNNLTIFGTPTITNMIISITQPNYVQLPSNIIDFTNDITICVWYRFDNNGLFTKLFDLSKVYTGGNNLDTIKLGRYNGTSSLAFIIDNNILYIDFGHTTSGDFIYVSWVIKKTGEWIIYKNGISLYSGIRVYPTTNTYSYSYLGKSVYSSTEFNNDYRVSLKDFRIYNRALTSDEIKIF